MNTKYKRVYEAIEVLKVAHLAYHGTELDIKKVTPTLLTSASYRNALTIPDMYGITKYYNWRLENDLPEEKGIVKEAINRLDE